MKIFVTNLNGYTERKLFMEKQLSDYNLEYEIIDCIDGRGWKEDDIKKIVSPRLFEMYQLYGETWLTKGAIAATQTHINRIFKKMVQDNIPMALVLEDDVKVNPQLSILLVEVQKQIERIDFDGVMLLYATSSGTLLTASTSIKIDKTHAIYSIEAGSVGCGCSYIITKKTAERLIKNQTPIDKIGDWWDDHKEQGSINDIRVVFPFPCHTGEFESTLGYANRYKVLAKCIESLGLGIVLKYFRQFRLSKRSNFKIVK
jgi:glycosyl transferase family 25